MCLGQGGGGQVTYFNVTDAVPLFLFSCSFEDRGQQNARPILPVAKYLGWMRILVYLRF